MEKLHTEYKLKLFEGITDNLSSGKENNNQNESLDLDFGKERNLAQSNHYNIKTPQNDVYYFFILKYSFNPWCLLFEDFFLKNRSINGIILIERKIL